MPVKHAVGVAYMQNFRLIIQETRRRAQGRPRRCRLAALSVPSGSTTPSIHGPSQPQPLRKAIGKELSRSGLERLPMIGKARSRHELGHLVAAYRPTSAHQARRFGWRPAIPDGPRQSSPCPSMDTPKAHANLERPFRQPDPSEQEMQAFRTVKVRVEAQRQASIALKPDSRISRHRVVRPIDEKWCP